MLQVMLKRLEGEQLTNYTGVTSLNLKIRFLPMRWETKKKKKRVKKKMIHSRVASLPDTNHEFTVSLLLIVIYIFSFASLKPARCNTYVTSLVIYEVSIFLTFDLLKALLLLHLKISKWIINL